VHAKSFESYEIVAEFPYSFISQKQGILVKQRETGKIVYYLKGDSSRLASIVQESQHPLIGEFSKQIQSRGQKAQVFAQKLLTEAEVEAFLKDYE